MASYTMFLEPEAGELDLSQHWLKRTFINQSHRPKTHEQWRVHDWRNIWGKVVGVTGNGDATRVYVRVSLLEFVLIDSSGDWDLARRP